MSAPPPCITPSLVDDPRHKLEKWLENVETNARSMCAMHDVTGALTLVMTDEKWQQMPINLTNPVDVAAGQPAVYRARPTFDMPPPHANNAASAVVNIHRMAVAKHQDYSFASTTLTTALLASIGEANEDTLRTTFPALAPYMLIPRQIVDTMLAKHGVVTGDDVSKLLLPLSQPLTALSDLTKHMSSFLLASQRLTRSGQGETPYNYFKLFLETVSAFPSVGMCMTTYYSAHPAIINQSLATLFPHLENMKDYLLKADPGTPFSGLAQQGRLTRKQRRERANQPKNKGNPTNTNPRTQVRTPRWSPNGPTLLAATPAPTPATTADYAPYIAEIQRLQAVLTAQAQSPYPDAHFGMPVPQPITAFSASRPREFYCWLHGWNNTHHGPTCKIMGSNTSYTHAMKTATGPENTGGNPKVGVPVHRHRFPSDKPLLFSMTCLSCLPSPAPFSTPHPPTTPTFSLASSGDKALALPHEATRARTALMATPLLEQAEGFISCPQEDTRARLTPTMVVSREQSEGHTPTPYEDTRASQARKIIASHQLPTSEGHNLRVRDLTSLSVSWSLPLVSMSISPSIFSLPARNPNPHTQHKLRHDPPPCITSRFASINRFAMLSDFDDTPPAPVEPPKPSHTQALSSASAPPLIADTGCTGLLLQFSNYPALSPFFTPKPLPLVPFTLPDRSVLLVGGPSHLTGELSFPHKALPVSAYFLPDSALSHSLIGISPLIRPHGVALFTPTSVNIFDTTDSPIPFLSGTKSPNSDLWFFSVPNPHPLSPPHTALFSLNSLPLARFVAYHRRCLRLHCLLL